MLNSFLCTQEDLEKDNGHSLVLYQRGQSTRNLGQNRRKDVVGIRRERMSKQRSTQKQRAWKTVDTLCSRPGNDWDYFSHNCFGKPAQSSRSSRGNVRRIWIPSRENGATRCDGTIKFLTRAQCDQDRKFLWIVMTLRIKISYCNNLNIKLRSCHNKTNWVNSVWSQDL